MDKKIKDIISNKTFQESIFGKKDHVTGDFIKGKYSDILWSVFEEQNPCIKIELLTCKELIEKLKKWWETFFSKEENIIYLLKKIEDSIIKFEAETKKEG